MDILAIVLTGVISAIATTVSLRTDIKWIIQTLKLHHQRLTILERKKNEN